MNKKFLPSSGQGYFNSFQEGQHPVRLYRACEAILAERTFTSFKPTVELSCEKLITSVRVKDDMNLTGFAPERSNATLQHKDYNIKSLSSEATFL